MSIEKKEYSENYEEIEQMESSYRTLHKLIKSGMWKMYCNRQFQIVSVEWSDDLRRMIGYKNEEDFPNVFEAWADLLHPDDYDRIMREIDPVLQDTTGNTIFDQEYRLNTKDRGYRWFRATADVSRRADGTPYCFFGVFIDVTEQKEHAELERTRDEALKKANSALTSLNVLHEALGAGAWNNTFDERGKSVGVEWSDAFRAMLGYEDEKDFPNEIESFTNLVHPDDLEGLMAAYVKATKDRSGKIVYDKEFRAMTKKGEYRWFRTTGRMTEEKKEKAGTFYGMLMDIDDKKKADEAIAWRDTLADVITQNLDSVYFVMNKGDRRSIYVSPSIERIFGIPKETPRPLLAVQKIENESEKDFKVDEIRSLPEGQSMVQDCWITPIGSTVPKMFQKTLYHVRRGMQDLLIFEFADHTHEQEIRKNIEEAMEIAKNANAAKSSFLSNMSHDIRTPMNVIIGLTNLMKHEVEHPEKQKEYIEKLEISTKYLLELINNVLDMSKIESGETKLNVEKFNILDQIEEIETMVRPQAVNRRQTFEIHTEHLRHKYLEGDALRIRQIFINIIGNAVKYTQEGGNICFEIKEIECNAVNCAKYCCVVTDNGMGMKPEYIKHIFEPFTRQENSLTNQVQGTGLGMAITKNIVDMLGGIIRIESEEGKGSRFEVILELKIDQEAESQGMNDRKQTEDTKEEEAALNGMRFLCAEDNKLNAEILQAMLELAGADSVICSDGKEIVEKFEDVKPGEFDMILMDVQMPGMNGYEATKAIRKSKNPLGKEIPIIAMTANAFSDDIQKSMDAGMNAHISKPMDIRMLAKVVKHIKNSMQNY